MRDFFHFSREIAVQITVDLGEKNVGITRDMKCTCRMFRWILRSFLYQEK